MLAGDALGMKLHAVDVEVAVRHRHDEPVRLRRHLKLVGGRGPFDDEAVIARRLDGSVDAAKQLLAIVRDGRDLAMHRNRQAHDLAPENLPDGLMAQTHAEDRRRRRGGAHEVEADAGLVGRAGTGRDHDGVGLLRQRFLDRARVVAPDSDIRAQFPEEMDEIEGETVVVIDQRDAHGPAVSHGACESVKGRLASAVVRSRNDARDLASGVLDSSAEPA